MTAEQDTGRCNQVESRLRQDRKAESAGAAAIEALVDAGVIVIDRPGYRDGPVTLDHRVDS